MAWAAALVVSSHCALTALHGVYHCMHACVHPTASVYVSLCIHMCLHSAVVACVWHCWVPTACIQNKSLCCLIRARWRSGVVWSETDRGPDSGGWVCAYTCSHCHCLVHRFCVTSCALVSNSWAVHWCRQNLLCGICYCEDIDPSCLHEKGV